MVDIIRKRNCCGCEACAQICPKKCISLSEDNEGFLYPLVDKDACIDCGLCEKVCPVIHQGEKHEPIEVFAAKNPDEKIRLNSSSGGVFTALAAAVIANGGVVFGASFNDQWEVVHAYSETMEGCAKFRGSKYVQCHIGNSYQEVESFLKEGREVLFSGTPCQVAGLRKYLRRDYDHLLTVDFICHGVPSPGMFRWYLLEEMLKVARRSAKKHTVLLSPVTSIPKKNALEEVESVKIESISFRNKTTGWKKYRFALSLSESSDDGEKSTVSLSQDLYANPFLKGFLRDLYLRPSCHHCPAKDLKSGSDMTIADFWGVEKVIPGCDDDKGISVVMVNSDKGAALLSKAKIDKVSVDYHVVRKYNASIYKSPAIPLKRNQVFHGQDGFIDRVNRLTKPTLLMRIKSMIKFLLGRRN